MSQIVAGLYELGNKIGSGGGGVVYLGRHIRLDKIVVLKADKRKLTTDVEKLRVEVDMLKNLSHTYIPQVYDFVQEDGVVYTVMDFIEGESLDKIIMKDPKPTQADVIKWACQLLEALEYLHTRPPYGILHADIKPANIMLRSNGDVCLIDYNIALALGEEGAVKIGFSRGYASPEHYGSDYVKGSTSTSAVPVEVALQNLAAGNVTAVKKTSLDDDKTEVLDPDKTEVLDPDRTELLDSDKTELLQPSDGASVKAVNVYPTSKIKESSMEKEILLDARSDIYSLGATLYHLLSGVKPAEKATDVVPLNSDCCSAEVSKIIAKSMAPNAKDRYQSAAEMRQAFLDLYKNDKRVVRHKRRMVTTAAALSVVFLCGGALTVVGQRLNSSVQESLKLAEYSTNELSKGNVDQAVAYAMEAIHKKGTIFTGNPTAEAQAALTDALGVYNLSDGYHALGTIELPTEPFGIKLSPDGTKLAAIYAYEIALYDMDSSKQICVLPTEESALCELVFINDDMIVYAGEDGVTGFDINNQKVVWTGEHATTLSLSGDRTKVAAVYKDSSDVYVYDACSGNQIAKRQLPGKHLRVVVNDIMANPNDNLFALNKYGSKLAISDSDGGLQILDLSSAEDDIIIYDSSDYTHFEGGFYQDFLAFNSWKPGTSSFGIVDALKAEYIGGIDSQDKVLLKVDELGIHMSDGSVLVDFDATTLDQKELAYTNTEKIVNFAVEKEYVTLMTEEGNVLFYDSGANKSSSEKYNEEFDFIEMSDKYVALASRDANNVVMLKREEHSDTQLLSYDARVTHEEARVSQDGKTIMLFSHKSYMIYDVRGNQIATGDIPDSDNIYDQQFMKTKDISYLEVIWYDGVVRHYSAVDGSVIFEEQQEKPNKDLYEEFTTEHFLVKSALHEPPLVLDATSGKEIISINEDAYLTYVTEIQDGVIMEFINDQGSRYGVLFNNKWQKIAMLPNMCDVWDDKVVFDYQSGDLRQSKVYNLFELVELGENYINK